MLYFFNSIPVILNLSGILILSCTISDGSFTASLAMFLAPSHLCAFISESAHWNVVIADNCLSLAAVALSRSAFSTPVHPLRSQPSRYGVNASTVYKDVVIICSGAKFGTWVVAGTAAAMSGAAFSFHYDCLTAWQNAVGSVHCVDLALAG